jgi:hypothetical protein
MTQGQHGSLLLYCKRLSLSITHRFAPAHRKVKKVDRALYSLKTWFSRELAGRIPAEMTPNVVAEQPNHGSCAV